MSFVLILLTVNPLYKHETTFVFICAGVVHSPIRVLCLSSGYRGQKGERGQLGLGLPGDPGPMGPPGESTALDQTTDSVNTSMSSI